MYKEIIISAIIIISIFWLDSITQSYTDYAINKTIENLNEINRQIETENADGAKISEFADEKYEEWLNYHKTLAFYIEHNELEKIETNFVSGKSYIKKEKYEDAKSELDKTIFLLEHVNDKYSINWANIF